MDKNQLRIDLEKLHQLKKSVGNKTYGETTKGQYALNNLTRKIAELINFLQAMNLPDDLAQAREEIMPIIQSAATAINQEYAAQEFDPKGNEIVTSTISDHSYSIRQALNRFDAKSAPWR